MRKVERDLYLQILDNLWMQHLENMEHLREGIHWISVGQRDPLVEYRRQGGLLFDEFLATLRHDVLQNLFNARPVDPSELERPIETELTRAARQSVDNANRIIEGDSEFEEADFTAAKAHKPGEGPQARRSSNRFQKSGYSNSPQEGQKSRTPT
jgi:preprotein translocase subunit SecA